MTSPVRVGLAKLSTIPRDFRWLVTGEPGAGKTHLIGTLCAFVPTVVVTANPQGLDVLETMGLDPDVVLLRSWEEAWDAYEVIAEATRKGVKAIALDDFGAVQDVAMDKILVTPRGKNEERMERTRLSALIRQQLVRGERRLQLAQFGELATATENFLNEVLRLPAPIKLVTVIEEARGHPRTGEEHMFPNLVGSIRDDFSGRFSLVAEAFKGDLDGSIVYALTSRTHTRLQTKDRYMEGGGRTWINPTAERLLLHAQRRDDAETGEEQRLGVGIPQQRSRN